MKTRNIFLSAFATLAVFAIGFTSCSKTDANRAGQFRVLLTDAPGDYIAAEIDIVKVEVKVDTGRNCKDDHFADGDRHEDDHLNRHDEFGTWTDLKFTPGVIDVMTLRNGVDAKIAEGNIVGTVRKVRVTLGAKNTVTTKDGVKHDLVLQNETENYLYVHLNNEHRGHGREQAVAQDQEVVIDFDVARSIVESNGVYYLRPQVRPFHDQNSGAIEGQVLPANIFAVVTALDANGAEVAKALPKMDGYFKIRGLVDGAYTLKFEATGYQTQSTKVTAVKGQAVKVNTITLVK
jgi:Domain of unknown function (DUF4382)/Carboxypeptidase regulatory-like domain